MNVFAQFAPRLQEAIVAPIKALLNNQSHRLDLYTEMVGLKRFVWHGDTPAGARRRFFEEPAHLLMTTPESLEVMLMSQRVDAAQLFQDLRMFIVDEVHAIAGSDRGAHLMSVLERIATHSEHDIQRVGLSATVGNPDAILAWLQGTSQRDGRVINASREPNRRQIRIVHRPGIVQVASEAAGIASGTKSLFFCQSRATTEAVAEQMSRHGTTVFVHHSAVSKEERELAEERFHSGSDTCIVCTSTLELGIDVGDLDHVLQSEAPGTVCAFLQRMGRTGRRANQVANTTFFCETSEGVLQAIAIVELAKTGWVESVDVNHRCWPVLIHQLLAMSLAAGGVSIQAAWDHLSRVPDFCDIEREEFDRLIAWMIRDGSMILTSGLLSLGPKAERRFGRRNFMELFAVFSSPRTYSVATTSGQPLGSLTQEFVDRLVCDVSSFLLGGRAWAVSQIQHDERCVVVVPSPIGRQPSWGGFLPQFLGKELCQQILRVVATEQSYNYLDAQALAVLQEQRSALSGFLDPERGGISDGMTWLLPHKHNCEFRQMFLTLEDPRATIQGSRDPLGAQPIWSRFGRDVVTNLTTVSRAVRGFTVNLLGRYYTQRLIDENRAGEEDAVPIFLRIEQIAAYARYVGRPDSERGRILGVTRVARFLEEHRGKVPIKNSSSGFILSDQKTYGLWGLYSVSARVSSLLADGPVGLTDWANDFVEQQYVPRLRSHESKLIKLIRDGGTLDAQKGRQPFQSVADILRTDFTAAESSFYGAALRDAERVERPSAPGRQKQLASLILKHLEPDAAMGREDVLKLVFAAEQSGMASLTDKLQRILRIEALLAPAEALFELILARNGQVPAILASHVADHWGSHVPNLGGPISPLMSEVRIAVGDDQASTLQQCDAAFANGNYENAIHALLELNRLVMEARGAAPWVRLNAGELDVRYRGAEQELPSGDELALLWRNSYFIDTLKDITFELEGRH